MDKRYQVFVSSTFADLKDERQKIMQTLMEMDCIPAGMELFPAADEEQLAFIEKIIDDCDYYLLLIGGRYGSTTPEGVSYTEKEYDYAIQKGIKVIALLHQNPEEIPMGKSEQDPVLRGRLAAFRDKVANGRLVRFWGRAEDLPGMVSLSLSKTIKTYPAVGWIRGNLVANEDALQRVEALRVENEALRTKLAAATPTFSPPSNIAGLDENFSITGTSWIDGYRRKWNANLTWRKIFWHISPYLEKVPAEVTIKKQFLDSIVKENGIGGTSVALDDQIFQTIGIQLQVLGLVKIEHLRAVDQSMHLYWSLKPDGRQLMLELRTVRSAA
ncbi:MULTISPECIES: DUF4062 domain-containing protein [unclassified Variovorax]|uniref:DUF4062 domain-containing protein n=1 Tax=unclassified Variovorax TaxID=663243 RepID=UPI00257846D0|nr:MULTISPECIES: DUF4062 domain-containing protein [unclassified Variovorax]MDM0086899.1 DUF4062 domain-containing protein [Variovorax sp. J22G40]MDM0144845.1 DUF4062 domain-containing protein [Variovorax sp. J2P1-31]